MSEFFRENGYLILRNHYAVADTLSFEWAAIEAAALLSDGATIDERILNLKSIGALYDTWSQMPEMLRLQGDRGTVSCARAILGPHPLFNFKGRCLIAPPHDERRTYGWHQQTFYSIPGTRFVQTWAPLIRKSTKENGTIWICPKSHKLGPLPCKWTYEEGRADQIIVNQDVVDQFEQVQVELEVGDMLMFDSNLIHKSGENRSKEVRYSLVGEYHQVTNNFNCPQPEFNYRGKTPRQYFDEFDQSVDMFTDSSGKQRPYVCGP